MILPGHRATDSLARRTLGAQGPSMRPPGGSYSTRMQQEPQYRHRSLGSSAFAVHVYKSPHPHPLAPRPLSPRTWPLCCFSVPTGSAASATTARPRYSGVSLPASSGTPRQCCSSAGSATGIHAHVRAFALTSSCPALASSCAACCTMPFHAQRRRLYRHDARSNFREYYCPRASAGTTPDYSLQCYVARHLPVLKY